jgi:hypothetical protein
VVILPKWQTRSVGGVRWITKSGVRVRAPPERVRSVHALRREPTGHTSCVAGKSSGSSEGHSP